MEKTIDEIREIQVREPLTVARIGDTALIGFVDIEVLWARIVASGGSAITAADGTTRQPWQWRKQKPTGGGNFTDSDDTVEGWNPTQTPRQWPAFSSDPSYSPNVGDIVRLYPSIADPNPSPTANHGTEWFFIAPFRFVQHVRITGPVTIGYQRQPVKRQVYKKPIGDGSMTSVFQDDTSPDADGWLLFESLNPTGDLTIAGGPIYLDGVSTQYPYPLGSYVPVVQVPAYYNDPFGDGRPRYIPWEPPPASWWSPGQIARSDQVLGLGIKTTEGIGLSPYHVSTGEPTTIPNPSSLRDGNLIHGQSLVNSYFMGGAGGSAVTAVSFTTGIGINTPAPPMLLSSFVPLIAGEYGFPDLNRTGGLNRFRYTMTGYAGVDAGIYGSVYYWAAGLVGGSLGSPYYDGSASVAMIVAGTAGTYHGGSNDKPGILFPLPILVSDVAVLEGITGPPAKTNVLHGTTVSGTGYKFINGICVAFSGYNITIGSTLISGGNIGGVVYGDSGGVAQSTSQLTIDSGGKPWFQGASGKWFSFSVGNH